MKAKNFRIGNLAKDNLTNELLICCELSCDTDGSNSRISFAVINRDKYPLPNGWQAERILIEPKWISMLGFKHKYAGQYELGKLMLSVGIDHAKVFIGNRFLIDVEFVDELQNLFFAVEGKELEIKHEASV